jgi:hypothetical protein
MRSTSKGKRYFVGAVVDQLGGFFNLAGMSSYERQCPVNQSIVGKSIFFTLSFILHAGTFYIEISYHIAPLRKPL